MSGEAPISSRPRRFVFLLTLLCCALVWGHSLEAQTRPLNPDSPDVKQMIERGLRFLEANDDDHRLGARCLAGLAFYKAGRKLDHPRVALALRECQAAISDNTKLIDNFNYSVGLAIVFLLETNPEGNKALAQRYVNELLRNQQRAGGWGI
jgi:hypothetical protein